MNKLYDLIIIGNCHQNFVTAEYATSLGARVALMTAFPDNLDSFFLNSYKNLYLTSNNFISYQDFIQEKQTLLSLEIIPQLTSRGVHFIYKSFTFNQDKKLHLITAKDKLIAPNYLLNWEKQSNGQELNHQLKIDGMTIAQLIIENSWHNLPENIGIVGNTITAIYLAMRLQQLQKNVTLFSENNHLLPWEDEDISWYLQLYLEGKGIKFHFNQNYHQDDVYIEKNNHLQLIISAIDPETINDNLGLANLGVKSDRQGIKVNHKLQTHHPQIYAFGNILGGYCLENMAESEGKIAVENALFLSWQKIDYSKIPYILNSNPPIYRLGYTEKQARLFFSNTIKIITIFPTQNSVLLADNSPNIYYLKIIVDRRNYIIGFHALGLAEEIFSAVTTMVQKKQPLPCLFKLNFADYNSQQLVKQIKQRWAEKHPKRNDMIMSLRKTFLIWKNDNI